MHLSTGQARVLDCNVHLIAEKINADYSKFDFPIALIERKEPIKSFDCNKRYTKQMHKIQNKVIADGADILVILK